MKTPTLSRALDHVFIASTLFFGIYSQVIMRWQIAKAGQLPSNLLDKLYFICNLFLNPWILTSIIATLFAGISWMLTMTRFEISYAYPWMSLNFILIMIIGSLLFHEPLTPAKSLGTLIVMAGIIVIARS